MAISKLDIINRALQKLGAKKLTVLTGTDIYTTAANRCYAECLEYELRTHNWNFAIRRARVPVHKITITGISQADPGVVTYTGVDPYENDTVYIEDVVGMTEVNVTTFRIKNLDVSAKTFDLYSSTDDTDTVDTSAYTAYTSGGTGKIGPAWGYTRRFPLPSPLMTITGITQANPAVVTYTGNDPQGGDRIYIENVTGMTEVNDTYFVLKNLDVGAKTFELTNETTGANINSSAYTAYSSGGTAKSLSFLRMIAIDGFQGVMTNLGGLGHHQDFTIENESIVCNDDGPLEIRYVFNETNVKVFDSMFKEALACKLALEMTHEIKQDDTNKNLIAQDYMMTIKHAKMGDSIETPAEVMPESDWLQARL
jgi:hypothetical protein